jgi:CheY-like chemotaxis protein
MATILCVDDEEEVLRALQRVFLDESYCVLTAVSGAEGLAIVDREPLDLIISDYRMPSMNGAEFLGRVHASHPEILGIVLSGHAEASTVARLIEQRVVYTFVAKPWNNDELRLTVMRGLEAAATRRENARLAAALEVVEQLPAGLMAIDRDGVVSLLTRPRAHRPLCGGDPDVGASIRSVLLPQVVAAVQRVLAGTSPGALIVGADGVRAGCYPLAGGGAVLVAGRELVVAGPLETVEL